MGHLWDIYRTFRNPQRNCLQRTNSWDQGVQECLCPTMPWCGATSTLINRQLVYFEVGLQGGVFCWHSKLAGCDLNEPYLDLTLQLFRPSFTKVKMHFDGIDRKEMRKLLGISTSNEWSQQISLHASSVIHRVRASFGRQCSLLCAQLKKHKETKH